MAITRAERALPRGRRLSWQLSRLLGVGIYPLPDDRAEQSGGGRCLRGLAEKAL
jgi:hypothetical protein